MAIDLTKHTVIAANTKEAKSFLQRDIRVGSSKLSDKRKEQFYHELESLLTAGLDLKASIEMLANEQKHKPTKQLMEQVNTGIQKGNSFSKAMENTGKFSAYEYCSIGIGEETGNLDKVLKQLASYYDRKVALRRQLVGAFSYPAFMFLVTIGVIWFMITTIVPMFSQFYERLGEDLPAITSAVLNVADFVKANGGKLVIVSFLVIAGIFTVRKRQSFRRITAHIVLRIPFFGNMARQTYLARFCQSMTLLISSRTPLVQAMELVEKMIGYYPIETAVHSMREKVMRGIPLHVAMSEHQVFPSRLISMIKVAEEVNQLDTMFDKLNNNYTAEVEHRSKVMGSVLEPVMFLLIGALVGTIVIAMYMPVFQLSTTIG